MARRKKSNPLGDLYDIASFLPWWASLGIAVVAYFALHALANAQIGAAKSPHDFSGTILMTVVKAFAMFGQFIVPMVFLGGAAASAIAQAKRGGRKAGKSGLFDDYVSSEPVQTQGTDRDTDLSRKETDQYPIWKTPSGKDTPGTGVDTTRWSPELLRALEWKRFEEVCAALFEHLGFTTRTATTGPDGGVDIHLYRPPQEQAVAIVQCKARTNARVGVAIVRELRGVMASMRIAEGILATTSTFSDDAQEFARENHIDLMDGSKILRAIDALTEAQQASLLQRATAGDFTTPTCASCGVKMARREPKVGGRPFWGCVNYPRCTSRLQIARS